MISTLIIINNNIIMIMIIIIVVIIVIIIIVKLIIFVIIICYNLYNCSKVSQVCPFHRCSINLFKKIQIFFENGRNFYDLPEAIYIDANHLLIENNFRKMS